MKSAFRIAIAVAIILAVAGLLVWAYRAGRSEQAAEAERDAPLEAPSRAIQEAGKTVLTFDEQAQHANGIAVTVLRADRRSAEVQANGVVLQLQPLLDLKASTNSAKTEMAKARAAAQASQAEYKRLLGLNQSSQNVSEKAVEAARATSESDAAVLENAEQSLTVLKDSMRLHWGTVITSWLERGSPQFDALLEQNGSLIQVTAPNNASWTAPAQAVVQLPGGAHASARLIASLPQLDPRLQAPGFLYVVSARPPLVPGTNLSFYLPAGPARNGSIVPDSAVVWWQGRAWCYVEESSGKFTRAEVSTANPPPSGWFVSDGRPAGARVVTAGAQTLLSEEFRSQIQPDQTDEAGGH